MSNRVAARRLSAVVNHCKRRPVDGRNLRLAVAAALALACLLSSVSPPFSAADTAPPGAATPATVSSDPLPTVQVDGVVWTQVIVGNTVYVGGRFTTARPAGAAAGTQTVPRSYLLAYDLTTGKLLESFAPTLDNEVRALAASPDGKTLYVGGSFTRVNGAARYRVAAFDIQTGQLNPKFAVVLDATVYGLAATETAVYMSGTFTRASGAARTGAAAVTPAGSLLPFAVTPTGGTIRQIIVSPDRTKAVLGGNFTSLNGSANPGYGLALVNAATGASLAMPMNAVVRNGAARSAIMSLVPAPEGFYGAGYTSDLTQGNLEGAFRADWQGRLVWLEDCHGDTYSVALSGNALYVAGHPHFCGNVGAFPETDPWTFHRALAFTRERTGILGTDPHNYPNFAGQPAPTQLHWYPDINTGTVTGQNQGPWSVAANDSYVAYGGEFTQVNGKPQQGLVRFATKQLAPNRDGPRLAGSAVGLAARPYGTSGIRLSWPANHDRDNERLHYRLYRNGQLLHESTADSAFYRSPWLNYLDREVTAGGSYSYKLRISDAFDNAVWSSEVTAAARSGSALTRYQAQVLADGPESYWPMNDGPGTVMSDLLGKDNGTHGALVTTGGGSAIIGESGSSFRFAGSDYTSTAGDRLSQVSPQNFSIEAWFRTTTTRGGHLMGLDNSATGGAVPYADRHIYLSNDGRIFFAVKPTNRVKSVNSTQTYRDGKWHHVVGTLSGAGLKLYVDGVLVGHSADTKQAMAFRTRPAYWRLGGANLTGLPGDPTSDHLPGYYDEVAVYPVALTADQIKDHYLLGAGGAPNAKPSASFSAGVKELSVDFNASGSTDSDGSVATYRWDFGDGSTGSGVTASHSYSAAGSYLVQLTVTDDGGATNSASKVVTVPGGAEALVFDDFTRTVSSGLGRAHLGGDWTTSGATGFAVADGDGIFELPAPSASRAAYLPSAQQDSSDIRLNFTTDQVATGGGVYATVSGRRVSSNEDYRLNVRLGNSNNVVVSIGALKGSATPVTLSPTVAVPGAHQPGSDIHVRLQVQGTNPTRIQAKAWLGGSSEPEAWTVSATDSHAALQAAGAVGFASYLSGSATISPVNVRLHKIAATR